MEHYEVSNWSQLGFASLHNKIYWEMQSYLGIGTGAHSFLNLDGELGERFSFQKKISSYQLKRLDQMEIDLDKRSYNDYFKEKIMTGLRTSAGVLLSPKELKLIQGLLTKEDHQEFLTVQDNHLYLDEDEWIRENYWITLINDFYSSHIVH